MKLVTDPAQNPFAMSSKGPFSPFALSLSKGSSTNNQGFDKLSPNGYEVLRNKLALGTVQFGLAYGVANTAGQVSAGDAQAILALARQAGMTTLDTAMAYGNSESTLGAAGVAGWRVVTKLPSLPDDRSQVQAWVRQQVGGSLQRLGVAQVDAVLLHRPDQLFEPGGADLLAALQGIKAEGLTRKIGVSVYSPDELGPLMDLARFDVVQAPLNLLDRRLVDSGWATRLKQAGVEVHTRSAFLQGLLLMNDGNRPARFSRWAPLWKAWAAWLAAHQVTALQACLLYPLSVDAVDQVVVGVDSPAQLQQLVQAASGQLPSLPDWPNNWPCECRATDLQLINPALWSQLT